MTAAFGAPASPALAASGTNVWPPTPAADLPIPEGASTFDPATGQLLRTNGAQTWSWDGARWSQGYDPARVATAMSTTLVATAAVPPSTCDPSPAIPLDQNELIAIAQAVAAHF